MLINVAFFTLFERKILRLSHYRIGPNKVSIVGILQPFADAVKLFSKEIVIGHRTKIVLFLTPPIARIAIALTLWNFSNFSRLPINWDISFLILLVILGLNLYPLLIAGWISERKYAIVGSLRGVAQTISYEICLALVLLSFLSLAGGIRLNSWVLNYSVSYNFIIFLPMILTWLVVCVAETNRTPFDFSEGESELVSGFNIEYGRGGFALLFMAEYAIIIFFSLISSNIVIGSTRDKLIVRALALMFSFWWVWIRATFPRYRYDKLISLSWKSLLPFTLSWLMFRLIVFIY